MPGLVAFKRRWNIASDDFVLSGSILAVVHLILFTVIAAYLINSADLNEHGSLDPDKLADLNGNASTIIKARCALEIKYSSIGYLCILITAMLLEIVIVGFSMQGTILNPKPRKPIEYLLYMRIVLGVAEVAYSIGVAVKLGLDWKDCKVLPGLFSIQAAIVAINAIVVASVVLAVLCAFDSAGGVFYELQRARIEDNTSGNMSRIRSELDEKRRLYWKRALRNCLCGCHYRAGVTASRHSTALDEVAQIFNNFFKDQDLVPSDVVTGLVLLRHKQQSSEYDLLSSDQSPVKEFLTGRPILDSTVFLDPSDPSERRTFGDMTYYCAYAVASYGPLMYLLEKPSCGLCGIMKECMCGDDRNACCIASHPQGRRFPLATVRGDVCCEWRSSTVRRALAEYGLNKDVDIVYASWSNELSKQPFFVAVDHNKQAIVVAVRGSLSNTDALTDMIAVPDCIPGQDSSWKGHKGIVEGAVYLKGQLLEEEMILSQAFGRDLARGTRNYKLVVLGHSLGAGVAAILAIMLKPRYPNLVCYSYSPPGGLLSLAAMEASKDFTYTCVLGKDVISRMGLPQLAKLRDEMYNLLQNTNMPKYRLILGNIFESSRKRRNLLSGTQEDGYLLTNTGETPTDCPEYENLYLPGRVFHVVYRSPPKDKLCCGSDVGHEYFAIESNNTEDFGEIIVSKNMVVHHVPMELLKAMKKVLVTSPVSTAARIYSESATLPVGTVQRNGRQPSSILAKEATQRPPVVEQPSVARKPSNHDDECREALLQAEHSPSNSPVQEETDRPDDVEIDLTEISAPLARIESFSESGSVYSSEPAISPSAQTIQSQRMSVSEVILEVDEPPQPTNTNQSNNVVQRSESLFNPKIRHDLTPTFTETKLFDEDHRVPSLASGLGDYMDAVLPDPHLLPQDRSTKNRRCLRSASMPGRASKHGVESACPIDPNTVRRARFEPNLIPKPPRSHSMKKINRPSDLLVSRDYSSAPPSRTTTPLMATPEPTSCDP